MPEAYKRMQLYVELARLEVGWLGTARRTEDGDFLIEHVFLLKQTTGAEHTRISEEGQMELYRELKGQGRHDDLKRLKFWGHSHVRMSTEPSSQDNATMNDLGAQGNQWFIRGIFNKLGRAQFSIYQYDIGLFIDDAPWQIRHQPEISTSGGTREPGDKQGWAGSIKDKVVSGAKRLVESFSTSPVSSANDPLKALISISAELRAEVEAEIRARVTVQLIPGWNRAGAPPADAGVTPVNAAADPVDGNATQVNAAAPQVDAAAPNPQGGHEPARPDAESKQ